MSTGYVWIEFAPIDLAGATTAGRVDTAWRQVYTREALEPAFHALLREAIATFEPGARLLITLVGELTP
jgi:hypothetical protein